MNKFSFIAKSLGLLSVVSVVATAQQAQVDIGSSCAEAYTIRVNQSQIEKGGEAQASAWIPVEIRRDIDYPSCGNEILISSGSDLNWQLDSGKYSLQVEPYDSRRNPLHISPSGAGWIFKLTPGSAQDIFWLRVLNPSVTPPGSYHGYIELSAASSALHTSVSNVITSAQFSYDVAPSVSMSFEASWGVSSGTYFNVNLGDLTLGSSKDFDMVLQSNTDVYVEVSSENKGYLAHEENSRQRIGYDLSIQSMPVNLSAPSSVPLNFTGNYTNWRIPMLLSVPAANRHMLAGSYIDTISVDVYPQE